MPIAVVCLEEAGRRLVASILAGVLKDLTQADGERHGQETSDREDDAEREDSDNERQNEGKIIDAPVESSLDGSDPQPTRPRKTNVRTIARATQGVGSADTSEILLFGAALMALVGRARDFVSMR